MTRVASLSLYLLTYAVMPGAGNLIVRVTRVRLRVRQVFSSLSCCSHRRLLAGQAGRQGKRAVLARCRGPPRGPGLYKGEVRLKPWSPQQVLGGSAVAEGVGLGVVHEVAEFEEGEDTHLRKHTQYISMFLIYG
jgi:hypothetical protein